MNRWTMVQNHKGDLATMAGQGGKDDIDEVDTALMTEVLELYGSLTDEELTRLSHSERPWRKAHAGIPLEALCTNVISKDAMREFYAGINQQ